ncbi:hypothetical protein [Legionella sp. W05-934-2]|jgi:hypothetical protein|uniref:hypothetical protein n=1 Tax=Legionella sp. W05-934-2 TaxID=1198649 RepID=UPI0034634D51
MGKQLKNDHSPISPSYPKPKPCVPLEGLINSHVSVLRDAHKLDIPWMTRKIDEANSTFSKAQHNDIDAITFLKQVQEIKQLADEIKQFEQHSNLIKEETLFARDFARLKQSNYFLPHVYEKLLNHIRSDEFLVINELAKNPIIHPEAISQLDQTLYDIDIAQDRNGKLYFDEMVAFVNYYCQEMKKDYAQDCQTRFREGLVRLLAEYRKNSDHLSVATLKTQRTNLSYAGLGAMGVLTFDLQISQANHPAPIKEPNLGQLALARVISTHHGLFGHKCTKHERPKEKAWHQLEEASTTKQQAKILRELATDIRLEHRSKHSRGGRILSIFSHSRLADQVESEAKLLEMAAQRASR